MNIEIKTRDQQHNADLFGGRLHENKPISGQAYSNLLYWAHVEALDDGEFGMHPHENIEILTFIFEGGLEHFDTATNVWTPLPAGGVQHIQAGKGLQHAEKYKKGSRAFQIWFDPDFEKASKKDPDYKDFQHDSFTWEKEGSFEVKAYVGKTAPIQTDAPGISANRYKIQEGNHFFKFKTDSFYSLYVLDGTISIENNEITTDSFVRISDANSINIETLESSDLFILQSPAKVDYKLVSEQ
ncbi:MAG: pirin family protein [Ghiorsea sp.]|nr:pirin family protein [Ghiorsea sp.]